MRAFSVVWIALAIGCGTPEELEQWQHTIEGTDGLDLRADLQTLDSRERGDIEAGCECLPAPLHVVLEGCEFRGIPPEEGTCVDRTCIVAFDGDGDGEPDLDRLGEPITSEINCAEPQEADLDAF